MRDKAKQQAARRAYQLRYPERVRESSRKHRQTQQERVRHRDRQRDWARKKLPAPTRIQPAYCECCGRAPTERKTLCLDHCHTTGAFRGWLCDQCNLGLGMLGDSVASIQRVMVYLGAIP